MITKQVNRYYCEFCGKGGQSASHISKHERHCTKNPSRECRVCKMIDAVQRPMAELLAVLPDVAEITKTIPGGSDIDGTYPDFVTIEVPADLLPKLREAANNCPACIMAALRQKGIPIPAVDGFHFSAEMKEIWSVINEEQLERDRHCAAYL